MESKEIGIHLDCLTKPITNYTNFQLFSLPLIHKKGQKGKKRKQSQNCPLTQFILSSYFYNQIEIALYENFQ